MKKKILILLSAILLAIVLTIIHRYSKTPKDIQSGKMPTPASHLQTPPRQQEITQQASPASPGNAQQENKASIDSKWSGLKNCYYNPDACSQNQSDPRAASFEVEDMIVKNLRQLTITESTSQAERGMIQRIALDFFQLDSFKIKEAIIPILADLSPEREILQIMITSLDNAHSAPLFERLHMEFQKYVISGMDEEVARFMARQIQTGSHFVSRLIVQPNYLLPLITPRNYDIYVQALNKLPPDTYRYRTLRQTLSDFAAHSGRSR